MRRIVQNFGTDLDWVESFAENFGGVINGNFIDIPDSIQTGNHYFLNYKEGITALYIDATYHFDYRLIRKNLTDDFVGVYYNLTKADLKLTFQETTNNIGIQGYNLFLIDSALEYQYDVLSGNDCFVLCIFIKKSLFREYFKKDTFFSDDFFNSATNTFIRLERMSYESVQILSELRKMDIRGGTFDLDLIATINLLLSEYLLRLSNGDMPVLQVVDESDLSGIIQAQHFLHDNVNGLYPGNKKIAQYVNMSETKFKVLFKKITGITPNTFFTEHKLNKAKETLEEKEMSVTDVCRHFNFIDNSYFASQFRRKFGVNPKEFLQQL